MNLLAHQAPKESPRAIPTLAENFAVLDRFMGSAQRRILKQLLSGEEAEHFKHVLSELAQRIRTMPKTYDTDGQGDNAVVHLHYFRGQADWFIVETDREREQLQAYGYVALGAGGESGYINIEELCANGVELDLYFDPKPLGEVKVRHPVNTAQGPR